MPGSWQPLQNQPTFNVDAMLLLTDGSILCHEYLTANWHRLVPNEHSDYAKGTWHAVASMPNNAPAYQNGPTNAPLYFASAVLRDGKVFCAGGEDNGAFNTDELLAAEIYDPQTDAWTPIATPVGWTSIGDASSCVLPDGRVLLGNDNGNSLPQATAIWDPESAAWSVGGNSLDLNSEEGWTLLPDGTVLAVQCTDVPNAQKYVIATNEWVSAGSTLTLLGGDPDPAAIGGTIYEMGPQVLMTDGKVFVVGANGHTGIYTPPNTVPTDPGSWANGPDFPADSSGTGTLLAAVDAPACLLPNGNVLCLVGTVQGAAASEPGQTFGVQFFEFDGVALNPVPGVATASAAYTYNCRLMLLPTGQVMLSTSTNDLEIYTPSGGPRPAWRPHITHVPRRLEPGQAYRLHGRQLNGLSQACAYGDDQQMATNYPLVRLRGRPNVGDVFCRTFDHSTMAVATGAAIHHTHFRVPDDLPLGEYRLEVIANGIASESVEVHVHRRHDRDDQFEHLAVVPWREERGEDARLLQKIEQIGERIERIEHDIEHRPFIRREEVEVHVHRRHDRDDQFEHLIVVPWRNERGEDVRLLQKIEQIGERIERIEHDIEHRPFIRREERADVGAESMRHHNGETRRGEDVRLLQKIDQIGERIERIEHEIERRPFLGEERHSEEPRVESPVHTPPRKRAPQKTARLSR